MLFVLAGNSQWCFISVSILRLFKIFENIIIITYGQKFHQGVFLSLSQTHTTYTHILCPCRVFHAHVCACKRGTISAPIACKLNTEWTSQKNMLGRERKMQMIFDYVGAMRGSDRKAQRHEEEEWRKKRWRTGKKRRRVLWGGPEGPRVGTGWNSERERGKPSMWQWGKFKSEAPHNLSRLVAVEMGVGSSSWDLLSCS